MNEISRIDYPNPQDYVNEFNELLPFIDKKTLAKRSGLTYGAVRYYLNGQSRHLINYQIILNEARAMVREKKQQIEKLQTI